MAGCVVGIQLVQTVIRDFGQDVSISTFSRQPELLFILILKNAVYRHVNGKIAQLKQQISELRF